MDGDRYDSPEKQTGEREDYFSADKATEWEWLILKIRDIPKACETETKSTQIEVPKQTHGILAKLEDPLEEERSRIEDLEYIIKVLIEKLQKEKVKDKEAKARLQELGQLESQAPVKRIKPEPATLEKKKSVKPILERRAPGERIRKKKKLSI